MKKLNQILGNIMFIIVSILVTWGMGSSIMDSFIQYGIISTILSFIIGIPVFIGAVTLIRFIEKKLKIR